MSSAEDCSAAPTDGGQVGKASGTGSGGALATVRIWARAALAVFLITGIYFVLPMGRTDLANRQFLLRGAVLLLGLAALTWLVTRQVRRALTSRRMAERLATLITLVDAVVVSFAILYIRLADQFTGLRTRLDALYFSVTTLTTVGYGDIAATGQAARAVVIVQMFFDLIIVTSAISIVIGALRGPEATPAVGRSPD